MRRWPLQLAAVAEEIGSTDQQAIIEQLFSWIEQDVKATPLKQLQGLIWRAGYEDGSLRAPIYEDAYTALTTWHQAGVPLAVYSSGSIWLSICSLAIARREICDTCFRIGLTPRLVRRSKQPAINHCPAVGYIQVIFCFSLIYRQRLAAQQAGWQVAQIDRPDCYPQGSRDEQQDWPQIAEFSS